MRKGRLFSKAKNIITLEKQLILEKEKYDNYTKNYLRNLIHEIRTPLNAIIGFTSIINSKDLSENKKEQYKIRVNENTERILNLMDKLQEVSYLQTNSMKLKTDKYNISEILKSGLYYLNHLKAKYNRTSVIIILNESVINNEDEIYIDYNRLMLVIRNILHNAVKNTDKGIIEFGYQVKGSDLLFFIKDTGKGFKENDNKLINSFFKDKKLTLEPSLINGFGLTVCKGIINQMKGKLWLENNTPNGTAFYFSIPYRKVNTSLGFYKSEKAYMS